jgi:sterol desaturase/sphingolipid hydroxylase (fatty acid hydroxylase superfamily)
MKQSLFNLLPPATVAVILTFWAFAPAAWVDSLWTITLVGLVVLAFVQAMEWVNERHAGWRINRQELLTDLFYVLIGITAISWASDTLANNPMVKAKESLGLTTPWIGELPFLVQVAAVMLLVEFGQYWLHRWMHNNAWLWSTHAPHHHITQLNAMKGYVGNPIELFLISLSVIAFLDFDKAPMFAAFNALGAISYYAHANVRADPPKWFSFFFTTIQHHSLHHTAESFEDTRCNYGNCVILFDRMFGTFREGESAVAGQDERKRLSVREQFLFPYMDWVERRRTRRV